MAGEALARLIVDYNFQTVLDIGCGRGDHARVFYDANKTVTAVDLHPPENAPFETIAENYLGLDFDDGPFDCIWASHVLEHQLDVHEFLLQVYNDLRDGGVLAITVPPMKPEIVGGHVSLWNMGLLFYRLILAGFDCREAIGKRYGYNISVIVRKVPAKWGTLGLRYDNGDIEKLARFFPKGRTWPHGFNGDIDNINW